MLQQRKLSGMRFRWAVGLRCADLQKYVRTGTNLVAGALEIPANRLASAAEVAREERLGDGDVGQPVRRLVKTVAFVRIDHVGDGYAFRLHGRDDRIALSDLAAHVVGAMEDQHRLLDAVDLMDR